MSKNSFTHYGDRCAKCGEFYTPFTLKKRGGGFNAQQCNCFAFGGEGEVPVITDVVSPKGKESHGQHPRVR